MILQGVLLQLAGLLSRAALLGLGVGGRMEGEVCLGETWWDREGEAGLGKQRWIPRWMTGKREGGSVLAWMKSNMAGWERGGWVPPS